MSKPNPYKPTSSTSKQMPRPRASRSNDDDQRFDVSRHSKTILPPEALHGTSMPRYVAAIIDFVGVSVSSMLVAKQVPEEFVWLQIATIVVVGVAYYLVPELIVGRTLGKLFTGIKVISLNGHPCTVWQIGVRTALRVLEVNPLLFGAIPAGISAILSPNNQRIGDRLARTTVVHSQFELATGKDAEP